MARQLNPDLNDAQKEALFNQGTEAPFTGQYLNHDERGMYTCANCGAGLFSSESKYESTIAGLAGWPSFADAAKKDAIKLKPDTSHGMNRTEVICSNCEGHLGHIFDDSSSPSGQHYCINSVCLGFKPASSPRP